MPQVFYRIEIWTFRGGTPPVDVFFFEESLCSSGRMLRVIILHEAVVGKFFSNERDKRGLQDVAKQISIHDTIKDTNL